MEQSPTNNVFINTLVRFLSIIVLVFFLYGCSTIEPKKTIIQIKTVQSEKTETLSHNKSKPHIFHFIQSELSKKKGDLAKAIYHINKAIESDPDSSLLKMELVKLKIYTDQIPQALVCIEEHLVKEPNNVEFLTILAQIKLSQNKIIEVIEIYKRIIEADPKQQSVYYLLGGIYSKLNRTDEAIKVFRKLVKAFPNAVSGYYYIGRLSLINNDTVNAKKAFKQALILSPEFTETLYALADIYEQENNEDTLFKIYKKIIKINPDDLRASLALIHTYMNKKMSEESEKILVNVSTKSSGTEIANGILKYYLKTKKFDQGTLLLNRFLKNNPNDNELLYLSGTCYTQTNNKTKAIEQFSKIKPGSSHYTNAALICAFHYKDLENTDKAISILEKAHLNIPSASDFILYLGAFHEEKGNFEKALHYYRKGIILDEKNTSFHFREGVILDKQNQRRKCIDKMKIVIKLEPENTNALNYLGYTYADMGLNLNEAEMLIKKALSYKPEDAYITDSLGWLYYKKGNIKKATALLRKAVNLVPNDPILLEHLGDAFIKNDNNEKALEFYMRSLKNKTKDKEQLLIKIDKINKENTNR